MKTSKFLFTETFDAGAPLRVDSVEIEHIVDTDPDTSYLEQDYSDCTPQERAKNKAQDAARLRGFNQGDWHYVGVRAKAHVSYQCGNGSRRLETFTSGGLWGIESDSSPEYFEEVEAEQLHDLQQHLKQFRISFSIPAKV